MIKEIANKLLSYVLSSIIEAIRLVSNKSKFLKEILTLLILYLIVPILISNTSRA